MMKKMFVLLVVTSMLAGCAEGIPDPSQLFNNCDELETTTDTGSVVILENESYDEIYFGNESKWIEVVSFTYTATHLSFEVDNNTVIFNNITYPDMNGYLYQYNNDSMSETIQVYTYELVNNTTLVETAHDVVISYDTVNKVGFRTGNAPSMGVVWFEIPQFDFDITLEYEIEYRLLTGKECIDE